jgi:GNAT superfamily N-acetyltransferase
MRLARLAITSSMRSTMNNRYSTPSTAPFILRAARPDEAALLTELSLRSKAYWGYDVDFMAKCVPLLQVTAEMIESMECIVADSEGTLLGYSLLQKPEHAPDHTDEPAVLENLFVDPDAIGKGVGQALLQHALSLTKAEGYSHLFVEADPNAEAFYLKYGAYRIGERESGIQAGRMLPWLRFDLS